MEGLNTMYETDRAVGLEAEIIPTFNPEVETSFPMMEMAMTFAVLVRVAPHRKGRAM